jgi:hypothetical protein
MAAKSTDGDPGGIKVIEEPRRSGSFAARTGQSGRAVAARSLLLAGALLLLLDAITRSPWGIRMGLFAKSGIAFGLFGGAVIITGTLLKWCSIRCPRCHAPIYWRHVTSQSVLKKDSTDPDRFGCGDCGYQPE